MLTKQAAPVASPARSQIVYPESDGKPLGETDFHIGAILYLRQALRFLFRRVENLYVAADMLLYFEEGDPSSRVSPDVFAVKGVPKLDRRVYKLWEEGVAPCTVVEVTSKSSQIEDIGTKKGLYEMMGVQEYLLFDPLGEYLSPRFHAFERSGGYYRPAGLSAGDRYDSPSLGVTFQPEGPLLRVMNTATGEVAPLLEEAVELAETCAHEAAELARQLEAYRRRFGAID